MILVILGSTGMLGSGLVEYFHSVAHPVIEVNRSGQAIHKDNKSIKFDILDNSIESLFTHLPSDAVIFNASGVIKHKIKPENISDLSEAIRVNTLFSRDLAHQGAVNGNWVLQIATDCVFSGKKGDYSESDIHDPVDSYGLTKSLGEVEGSRSMTLRTSMVGIEQGTNYEFLNWVIDQPKGAELTGYRNHIWNGLTTFHISKIIHGIISQNLFSAGVTHLVPANALNKYELMKEVSKVFGRLDLQITDQDALTAVNRKLVTDNQAQNMILWKAAGYDFPLSIAEMVSEYAEWVNQRKLMIGGRGQ